MLAERAREAAGELADVEGQLRLIGGAAAGHDVEGAILDIRFVAGEEEQVVADDRAADADAILIAGEARLIEIVAALDGVARDQPVVLIGSENLAVERVGAGAGDGGDDRGAGILIFRLEVGGEHPEFGDRELREGIAAADVLADRRRPG